MTALTIWDCIRDMPSKSNSQRIIPIALGLLAMALHSCQAVRNGAGWFGFSSGTEAAGHPRSLGIVLFQDDFSDPTSGWDRVHDTDGVRDYQDETYQFQIQKPGWYFWATPNLRFSDVRVEVQASQVDDEELHVYGVICRYRDPQNFYFFTVTSDGFYGISKFEAGQERLLGMETMGSSSAIVQGAATNHLGVECLGDQLIFYVNGVLLTEARDSSFSTGDVGIIASTLEKGQGAVRFDNFSVLSP